MDIKRFVNEKAVGRDYLADWYINSVNHEDQPVWTEEHIKELVGDFYLIPKEAVSNLPDSVREDDADDFEKMEISEELIRKGLDCGAIKLIDTLSWGYIAAMIENWWFFFETDRELERLPVQEYLQTVSRDEIVKKIHAALNDEPIKGETEDDSAEFLYYKAVLEESADAKADGQVQEAYIYIPMRKAKHFQYELTHEPDSERYCWAEDYKYSEEVTFADGTCASVEICGVQYQEGESNLPWTQAVLYRDGAELSFTEPGSEFLGDWELSDHDGRKYVIHVVACEDGEGSEKNKSGSVPCVAKHTITPPKGEPGVFIPDRHMIQQAMDHGFVSVANSWVFGPCVRVGDHLFPVSGKITQDAGCIEAYFKEHPIRTNKEDGVPLQEMVFCRDLFLGNWNPDMDGKGKYRIFVSQKVEIPGLATDDINLAIRQVNVLQEAEIYDDDGLLVFEQSYGGGRWDDAHPDYASNIFVTSERHELYAFAEELSGILKEKNVTIGDLEAEIQARFKSWWDEPGFLSEYSLAKLLDVRTLWCVEAKGVKM